MNGKSFAPRGTLALLAAAGALFSGTLITAVPAGAQEVGEVTVTAPHIVRETVGKSSSTGAPIEVVSLSREVGYSDLDLTTPAGVAAFKARVAETAKAACTQLDNLYPMDRNIQDENCIRTATAGGLAQVDLIMATAAGK